MVLTEVTVEWLRDKCKLIQKMFTKNHRQIISQFKNFKERTNNRLEKFDLNLTKLKLAEIANSTQFSINEIEYNLNKPDRLRMYDSLVPEIEENRKLSKMSMAA